MHITNQKGSWQGLQFVSTFTELKVAGLINMLLYKSKIALNLLLSRQKLSYVIWANCLLNAVFLALSASSEGMTNWRCFKLCGTFCLVQCLFCENATFKRIVLTVPEALPGISCAEQEDKIWAYQTRLNFWKVRMSHEWIGSLNRTSPKLLIWYSNMCNGHNSSNLKIWGVPL